MSVGHPNDPFCVQPHSSQETVLIVRENSKKWDCIDPFIESHNEIEIMLGKETVCECLVPLVCQWKLGAVCAL